MCRNRPDRSAEEVGDFMATHPAKIVQGQYLPELLGYAAERRADFYAQFDPLCVRGRQAIQICFGKPGAGIIDGAKRHDRYSGRDEPPAFPDDDSVQPQEERFRAPERTDALEDEDCDLLADVFDVFGAAGDPAYNERDIPFLGNNQLLESIRVAGNCFQDNW